MRNVAKGDVSKLCEHTRELMYELNAAGETTNDLLANLIEALKEAPERNFQRSTTKSYYIASTCGCRNPFVPRLRSLREDSGQRNDVLLTVR